MSKLNLKPASAAVKRYYATLEQFARGHFDKEGNIRGAFEDLLKQCARQFEWTVVPEYSIPRKDRNPLSVDAALLDAFNLPRGYWEAKDENDSLADEMKKKFEAGYPRSNIIFQRPTEALLFQDGRVAFRGSIEQPGELLRALQLFFEWRQPDHDSWDRAADEFSERIPQIAKGAMQLIEGEKKTNRAFVERFTAFAELCRESINPDLKDEAVEEMLVQHLLTERIFRRIFDNPEFTRRNAIAAEIEKVIDSLTKRHFSRDAFLRDLDPFYKAIEEAASTTSSYREKQAFLNKIYERFFQGINKKQADTHGIVYTPQPIVDFMVRSVEEILKSEFGRSLSNKDVHILDPFVGTGNFITRVMQEIKTSRLPQKYKEELHCNEIMLLPYYIANMNIEHAYLDRIGEYEPFEGICLADTLDMRAQVIMFAESNTLRIRRQRQAPIYVVIGNPPYNATQANEDDNNKNRRYRTEFGVDKRVSETYAKSSRAKNKINLSDPYVKAIRWASDRIGNEGVVALVTNSGFVDGIAADGMRKHLTGDFDEIFILDLGGNVRKNPKLSGSAHNVFGIQVGVSINIFTRRNTEREKRICKIWYARTDEWWTKEEKYSFLESQSTLKKIAWAQLNTNNSNNWLSSGEANDFDKFIPISPNGIFERDTNGVKTNRDAWAYNFSQPTLEMNIKRTIKFWNSECDRWERCDGPKDIDSFVEYDEKSISWSSNLKLDLKKGRRTEYSNAKIRQSLYRPFTRMNLYFDRALNERRYGMPSVLPSGNQENVLICATGIGAERPFATTATDATPDLNFYGPGTVPKWFPLFIYDEDGANRRENLTDFALSEFRSHYGQQSITKLEIFHYTYALLHHPEYRTRYAANLKRELPRIPYAPAFNDYARIGSALMKLHLEY